MINKKKKIVSNSQKLSSNKKNIVLVVSAGISFRNLFLKKTRAGLRLLRKEYNIVIITNASYLKSYKNYFPTINLIKSETFLDNLFNSLSKLIFDKLYVFKTNKILLNQPFDNNLKEFFKKVVYKIPNIKNYSLYSSIRKIHNFLSIRNNNSIEEQLKSLSPDYIFSLNPLSNIEYKYLLIGEKFCETFGVIKSFDNISSNGYMPHIPNNLFVWNQKMFDEAKKCYRKKNIRIFAVGSPQYDHLKNYKRSNLINERTILYCANAPLIYKGDKSNVEFLAHYASKLKINIILRIHQIDSIERWKSFEKYDHLKIYSNDKNNILNSNEKAASSNHLSSLNDQIEISSVVICSYSTIIYDALSRGKPCINLGFDGTKIGKNSSIKRVEGFEHIIPLLDSKCIDNVRSRDEMLERILYRIKNGFSTEEENSRDNYLSKNLGPNMENYCIVNIMNSIKTIQ